MIDFAWLGRFGYFITYFGDVYHGMAVQLEPNQEDFYIISKQFHFQKIRSQKFGYSQEELESYGLYIKSPAVIQKWLDENQYVQENITTKPYQWPHLPNRFKTMYVFGAGASANCVFGKGKTELNRSKSRPPLGPELFADRFAYAINHFEGLKLSLPKFEARKNDIENILEDDWDELISEYNPRLSVQHIQLQLYLQEIFPLISGHISEFHYRYALYPLFLQRLYRSQNKDKGYIFMSFNYDSILDQEIEKHFQLQFSSIEKYISLGNEHRFLLFKPHGSWNWGWRINPAKQKIIKGSLAEWIYKSNITPATLYYSILAGGEMINGWGRETTHGIGISKQTLDKDKIVVAQNGNEYFPALLLPYRDKDDFVMPHNHQLMLDNMWQHVEELVIIGWKGNEKLFTTKLKEKAIQLKKITIVNPDFEGVKKYLQEYLDLKKYSLEHVKDFEDYVLNKLE